MVTLPYERVYYTAVHLGLELYEFSGTIQLVNEVNGTTSIIARGHIARGVDRECHGQFLMREVLGAAIARLQNGMCVRVELRKSYG